MVFEVGLGRELEISGWVRIGVISIDGLHDTPSAIRMAKRGTRYHRYQDVMSLNSGMNLLFRSRDTVLSEDFHTGNIAANVYIHTHLLLSLCHGASPNFQKQPTFTARMITKSR